MSSSMLKILFYPCSLSLLKLLVIPHKISFNCRSIGVSTESAVRRTDAEYEVNRLVLLDGAHAQWIAI